MRLRCPSCGASASLDVYIAHQEAALAVAAALNLPASLGPALVRYLRMFRPAKRELSMDRVGRLLREIQPLIEAGQITRDGRVWPAPVDAWAAALEVIAGMDAKGELAKPLDGHGLLLSILARRAGKADAVAEAAAIERQRQRPEVVTAKEAAKPRDLTAVQASLGDLKKKLRGGYGGTEAEPED